MFVLDHVSITVKNLARARPFYDASMGARGSNKVYDRVDALGYGVRCNAAEDFHTYLAVYSSPAAHTDSRRHWCFKASSRAQVEAFYQAGLTAGGADEGSPGLRSHYHVNYFAAFLKDPDGNRIEAVCHRVE